MSAHPVRLHLVRHGRPATDTSLPAHDWTLASDARSEIERLRNSGALPGNARWVSSPEPKALGTARALTDEPIDVNEALREMRRPAGWLGPDEWQPAVHTSMLEPDTPARTGWETGRSVTDRVLDAVRHICAQSSHEEVVLVGHGTAWTLLVSALTNRPPDLAAWEGLRMPDHCSLMLDADVAKVLVSWGSLARIGSV